MTTDTGSYIDWRQSAGRSAASALDIYDRDSVEYELALHLARALRELDRLTLREGVTEEA